ncbi:MAG: cysteine hydrolase family protein [Thermoplasmatota archaeon]
MIYLFILIFSWWFSITKAVLIVDMINDFVYGKFGNKEAEKIVNNITNFLKIAEKNNIPIFFAQDNHEEDDIELDIWGDHAMKDEEGSETIPELKQFDSIIIEKHYYDSFFDTELEEILIDKGIDKIYLGGVTTDICVQHTAAGAFFRGYDVMVLSDCCVAMSKEKHKNALDYMKTVYGAKIENTKKVIENWKK